MPHTRINGVNIYYESHGSGFPLVLTYGLGGNTGEWAGQITAFSQRYRLILWDPRGHGKSDSPRNPDQYSMQISADDLHGLMDHLDIDKAYVGGLSMGGGISARYALAHPERVAALLIIDSASASGIPATPQMRAMREKTIELCETQGMEAVADYCIDANPNLATQAASGPEARQGLRKMYLELNPVGYSNTIRAMLNADLTLEHLPSIKMPTLFLMGELDPAVDAAEKARARIPGAEWVILPKAGHLPNLDEPKLFNQLVLEFLSKVDVRVTA